MVVRKHPRCINCGEQINAIYADRGKHFVGDTFIMWDYNGHKCKKTKDYPVDSGTEQNTNYEHNKSETKML